jgi:predicted acetyltransferase
MAAVVEKLIARVDKHLDAGLRERVARPEEMEGQVSPGPMVRLSSVSTLEELSWPETDLGCTMRVSDPLLDVTDGRFRLSVADGKARVETAVDSNPDITVDIATLSRLAIGAVGVETAGRLGTLEIETEAIREPLEKLFRQQPIALQEFF